MSSVAMCLAFSLCCSRAPSGSLLLSALQVRGYQGRCSVPCGGCPFGQTPPPQLDCVFQQMTGRTHKGQGKADHPRAKGKEWLYISPAYELYFIWIAVDCFSLYYHPRCLSHKLCKGEYYGSVYASGVLCKRLCNASSECWVSLYGHGGCVPIGTMVSYGEAYASRTTLRYNMACLQRIFRDGQSCLLFFNFFFNCASQIYKPSAVPQCPQKTYYLLMEDNQANLFLFLMFSLGFSFLINVIGIPRMKHYINRPLRNVFDELDLAKHIGDAKYVYFLPGMWRRPITKV